ncbi:hypothetical protein OEZ86_012532 [Tetradesmus obliquus]|nr:hypothetical protein OEZ86_012532 [Tetradesmus obliquus]
MQEACARVNIEPCSSVVLVLEATTLQALSGMRCDPAATAVEVVKLMDASTPQQIQMSKESGRNCFVPTAAESFRRGQPVGFFSGILQEQDKADRALRQLDDSRHLWFYDIPASALAGYGYTGPDLVLNMLDRGSELRFTQDAKWHNPNGDNNIAAVLWVLPMQLADGSSLPIPHIFCHAQTRQIRKGVELLLDWGDECWGAYHQAQVVKQGAAMHRLHLKLARVQQLAAQGIQDAADTGSSSSSSSEDDGSSEEEEEESGEEHFSVRIAGAEAAVDREESGSGEQLPVPAAPLPQDAFVPVAGLQLQQQCVWQLPHGLLADYEAAGAALGNRIGRLIVEGPLEGAPKLRVVDVASLHHLARWCTPPNVAARGAVAATVIERGEAITDYVGVVHTEADLSSKSSADDVLDQANCFTIHAKDLLQACPTLSETRIKDLVIDAREVGNESRFINCAWAREKRPDGKPHRNCSARVVWVKSLKRPAVRLFADRRIEEGEELVAHYGDPYWVAMGRSLQVLQMKHAKAALQQQEKLLRLLRAAAAEGRVPADEVEAAAEHKPELNAIVKFQA